MEGSKVAGGMKQKFGLFRLAHCSSLVRHRAFQLGHGEEALHVIVSTAGARHIVSATHKGGRQARKKRGSATPQASDEARL